MGERQPIRKIDPRDAQPTAKIDKPLGQPETKPFNGAVIGGIFMFPHPELTPEQKKSLEETIRNIELHRS